MLLYIDPGTGSALFSVVIGLITTVYFVARAVLIKTKFALTGKKGNVQGDELPYVVFCEGPQYLGVFLPVLESFEKRKVELHYYTSVQDDPAFTCNYEYIKSEYIGEGNTAIAKLNFLKAKVCLMTTPGLNVYQLKRSKGVKHYSHVLHMASDATRYRLFGIDYFDSVLLSGDYQKKDLMLLEEKRGISKRDLVTVGCPYLDTLEKSFEKSMQKVKESKNATFTVLVSPTWGKNSILSLYGEKLLDPLSNTEHTIIIRPHPQSKVSDKEVLEKLEQRYKDNKNIEWDYDRDNSFSIARSDVMISDLSGIIYDYAFLRGKPILYANDKFDLRPYDAYDLTIGENPILPWQLEVLPSLGQKLEEKDFENIETILQSLSDNKEIEMGRNKAKETAWMYRGESGERIANFMIQTANNIDLKNN